MRYVCLVYFDPDFVFNKTPEHQAILDGNVAYDNELKASGHYLTAEALQAPAHAVTLKVRNDVVSTAPGSPSETKQILGGFILIKARDQEEAVRLAAGIPLARLGSVEVRPVVDFS